VQRGRITERHISARLAQGDVSATNEAGCSASEIKAISGHVSLREVKRYTKAADQDRMGRAAINRLRGAS
jgi:hypothetical protein